MKRGPSWLTFALLCAAPLAVHGDRALAQTGIVGGTVYRDTSFKNVLTGVEVTIPALNRRTVTNYAGDFRLSGLPAGKYAMMLRHVGFAPLVDTVVVAANAPVDKEYSLDVQAVALDSVRVTEKERPRYISPGLNEFADRMKAHNGGYFMDETVLRKNDNRRMQDLLPSLFPGLHSFRPLPKERPTFESISSGRGTCNGPVFTCRSTDCPVALYVDGRLIFSPANEKDPSFYPDYTSYAVNTYAGVEYYPGGASVPPQYNATSNVCGVLMLWSRER